MNADKIIQMIKNHGYNVVNISKLLDEENDEITLINLGRGFYIPIICDRCGLIQFLSNGDSICFKWKNFNNKNILSLVAEAEKTEESIGWEKFGFA